MPVSAQECAASATIDADPLSSAAADLASAMSPLATSATTTVRTLSPPDPSSPLLPGAWWVRVASRSLGVTCQFYRRGPRRVPRGG